MDNYKKFRIAYTIVRMSAVLLPVGLFSGFAFAAIQLDLVTAWNWFMANGTWIMGCIIILPIIPFVIMVYYYSKLKPEEQKKYI